VVIEGIFALRGESQISFYRGKGKFAYFAGGKNLFTIIFMDDGNKRKETQSIQYLGE
jgi:hypothetical protein